MSRGEKEYSATVGQIEAFERYCQAVGAAMTSVADQATAMGYAPGITCAAMIGGLAALCAASGMKRENVVKALNSAWDDIDAG